MRMKTKDKGIDTLRITVIISIIFLLSSSLNIEMAGSIVDSQTAENNRTPNNSHIRTFINGGSSDEFLAQNFDIAAWGNPNAKYLNPDLINLNYAYFGSINPVKSNRKYQALLDYCDFYGLTSKDLEDMFLHAKEDVNYTLGEPEELDPLVTKLVLGWDPVNDFNDDHYIDNDEYDNRTNPNASARYKNESWIPIYRWGPPGNYQMNLGNDDYQDFIVNYYVPNILLEDDSYDGLWLDTLHINPTVQGDTIVLEYPDFDEYATALKALLSDLMISLPDDTIVIGNGWREDPIIISGCEYENWARITTSIDPLMLNAIYNRDNDGVIQLIQYKPIYDEYANPNRPDLYVEGITLARDQLYSLALYYLVCGNHTYYGYGTHGGYHLDEERWFDAINYDIGLPLSRYYIYDDSSGYTQKTPNLLKNGDFEIDVDGDGNPDNWTTAEPVELVSDVKHGGNYSAKIVSTSTSNNNMNTQGVTLEPDTTYTLSGWIKTDNVIGDYEGAQIYVYDFDDLVECDPWINVYGTTDWAFYNMSFTTGSDTEGNIKYRIKHATGTAWFDDLHLTEGRLKKYTVFTRDFQNATILLRTPLFVGDNTTIAYNLDGYYRPLKTNGTLSKPVNTIELISGEGAILVRDITDPIAHAGTDMIVNEDEVVAFDASGSTDNFGTEVLSYFWDFNASDGVSTDATGIAPDHIYYSPGTYLVTLNVSDGSGNWDVTTVWVTVLDTTNPTANAGVDRVVDEDIVIEFNANSSSDNNGTSGLSYLWDFDVSDGIQVDKAGMLVNHTFETPGIFIVTLTVSDEAGNWAIDIITIIVNDTTNPQADAGLDQTIDEDTILNLDANNSTDNHPEGIKSYEWSFFDGDQIINLSGSKTHYRFSEPGDYIINLTVEDPAGNSNSDTAVITVKDITSPQAHAGSDLTVVEGAVVTFDGTESMDNTGTLGLSFSWTFTIDHAFTTLSGMNPVTTFSSPGTYLITLNVSDSAGNWDIDTIVITVLPDSDGDGISDSEDRDDDNDMVPDNEDEFPLDPDVSVESAKNNSKENDVPLAWLLILILVIIVVLLLLLFIIRHRTKKISLLPWEEGEEKLPPPIPTPPPGEEGGMEGEIVEDNEEVPETPPPPPSQEDEISEDIEELLETLPPTQGEVPETPNPSYLTPQTLEEEPEIPTPSVPTSPLPEEETETPTPPPPEEETETPTPPPPDEETETPPTA
jgi:PKD repeat protein